MGKLHTLRRAILRNPGKWRRYGNRVAAERDPNTGEWRPYKSLYPWLKIARPYNKFILHVLNTTIDHMGDVRQSR